MMCIKLISKYAAVGGIVRSDIGSPGMFVLPFYYMLTSTGLTFFVAISATTTIIVGMNGLAKLQQVEKTAFGRRASEVSACMHGQVSKLQQASRLH